MKKKLKHEYDILEMVSVPYNIIFCRGMTQIQALEYIKKKYKDCDFTETLMENARTSVCHGKTWRWDRKTIVWIRTTDPKERQMATAIHEAEHAANHIIHCMGIEYDIDISEELFAYYTEYISMAFLRKLKLIK